MVLSSNTFGAEMAIHIHLRNKWIDYARTGRDLKVVLHVLRVDCLTTLADGHRDNEAISMRKAILHRNPESCLHVQTIDARRVATAHDPLAEAVCLLSGLA